MRKIIFVLGCFALALAGCGQGGPAAAPTSPPVAPTAGSTQPPTPAPATNAPTVTRQPTEAPTSTATQPAATPSESPKPGQAGGTPIAPPPELVSAPQQQLALHLKVSPSDLSLQSAEAREWPDGGLGCPAEGMVYPQVVTPGFLLIFTDSAQSVRYEVHTGRDPTQIVLCENGQPVELSINPAAAAPSPVAIPPDPAGARMGELARAALGREQGLADAEIVVEAVEATEWRDSSLGCPKPGLNYLQVITPGYKITLEAQGKRYEYHSDRNQRVVRCDQP